ncbi:MAG TPA: hypothetical protein VK755_09305 [Candidatus Acidoferrales bacterium]|nr:hypothetical protein [Candidatus Acidoferrales bacterium]
MIPRFYAARHALAVFLGLTVAGCAGTNVTPASLVGGAPALRVKPNKASYKRALYVANYNPNTGEGNSILIFTSTIFKKTYYRELGAITNGIVNPVGLSMDRVGNLYVANFGHGTCCGSVTEYAPGGQSPSSTYNNNMVAARGVTVDRLGNVYEADESGYVNEYFQGLNYATASCPSPGSNLRAAALAVDAGGDVFVSYLELSGPGPLYEYKGGLNGCNATYLVSVGSPDIVLDSNENLIVANFNSSPPSVDVLDPPYTAISREIGSGFKYPTGLSINKKNNFAFVADAANENVTVISYQNGANTAVLGGSYGIKYPSAVVDGPNAVY